MERAGTPSQIASRDLATTMEVWMPYAANEDLPAAVQLHLPVHAQDIYREAFNHAWMRYGGDERTAHRVAWSAVKRAFVKRDGEWVSRIGEV